MAGQLRLGRNVGEEVEIRHRSGDVIRVVVRAIRGKRAELGFDDSPRNFEVHRRHAPSPATVAGDGAAAAG